MRRRASPASVAATRARGVLAEHQVGCPRWPRRSLFVLALDRSAPACQRLPPASTSAHTAAVRRMRAGVRPHLGAAALCGEVAARHAPGGQPIAHHVVGQRAGLGESSAKRAALTCRDKAAEAGQVLEYSTEKSPSTTGSVRRAIRPRPRPGSASSPAVSPQRRGLRSNRCCSISAGERQLAGRQPCCIEQVSSSAPRLVGMKRAMAAIAGELQVQARHVDAACCRHRAVDAAVDPPGPSDPAPPSPGSGGIAIPSMPTPMSTAALDGVGRNRVGQRHRAMGNGVAVIASSAALHVAPSGACAPCALRCPAFRRRPPSAVGQAANTSCQRHYGRLLAVGVARQAAPRSTIVFHGCARDSLPSPGGGQCGSRPRASRAPSRSPSG